MCLDVFACFDAGRLTDKTQRKERVKHTHTYLRMRDAASYAVVCISFVVEEAYGTVPDLDLLLLSPER